jgi:maltoporin
MGQFNRCLSGFARASVWAIAMLTMWTLQAGAQSTPAGAQSTEDVRKQLSDLKQQYEQSMREFQQRITDLEAQIDKQQAAGSNASPVTAIAAQPQPQPQPQKSPTVSVTTLAEETAKAISQVASETVGAQYQGELPSEPTYDLLNEADEKVKKLNTEVNSFEFHGYFRSGAGLNGEGGQMVTFQAPGAGAKYRLGNEADTYGEWIFVNNWMNPDNVPGKASFKTEFMLQTNTTNSDTYANFPNEIGNDQFRLREAFVRADHLFDGQPGAKFWAGERYYRPYHIDIDDFFPLDMSGYGGGVEDLDVRFGKVAVAVLGGARPDFVTQNGVYAKSNVDVRLYDVKALGGLVGTWFDFALAKGGTSVAGTTIPTSNGFAGGVRLQKLEWHGGFNSATIQYGTGAASNFATSVGVPNSYLPSTERLLMSEQMLLQPNDRFAIMPIFVYQRMKDGNPLHGHNDWVSFGARPVVFLNRYVSFALEGGLDYTDGYNATVNAPVSGWVRKITFSPQLGAGQKFFSRPVLRTFITYANWSNEFRGLVGGIPYQNKTGGLTFGVQAESWW